MWTYNQSSNELYHYGVLGMKWGVRHDYEKKGYPKSKKVNSEDKSKKKKGLSDIQKRRIKIGAAVALTALAAYGTYKFVDSGKLNQLILRGKNAISGKKIDRLKLQKNEFTFKKDMRLADKNMEVDDIYRNVVTKINPNYGEIGTVNNCRRCTFAYELSRRGYDVQATRTLRGSGQTDIGVYNALNKKNTNFFKLMYKEINGEINLLKENEYVNRPKPKSMSKEYKFLNYLESSRKKIKNDGNYSSSIFSSLSSNYPDRARGELGVTWKGGGGHSMAWEIINGKPVIFDTQTSRVFKTSEDFKKYGDYVEKATITRLDNANLDNDFLLRWLKDYVD